MFNVYLYILIYKYQYICINTIHKTKNIEKINVDIYINTKIYSNLVKRTLTVSED